ncbi:TetR/AcrR family transcriptional regulator [Jannaschia formosa]|uniref:TetR/AcrR family transcriptional regulator n=1 Tax=Jannaschia formosa TaxID=2259592 RepID=UPI0014322A83|nr:TetR/AcrR family transcriptional regulator [Jannaschia formosa]
MKPEQALDAAMRVFWAEGYDAASIDRLCRETGMPRASLYQDFGGKEGLFLAAIARYVDTRIGPVADALGSGGTLEGDLSAFFTEVVALATGDAATPGCLISCVLSEVAGANETFRQELDRRFRALEDRIVRRLDQEAASGATTDKRALAGMLAAVARGIMLRARSGAQARDLDGIASVAVRSAVREVS